MRVVHHPILGDTEGGREVTIFFNGKPLDAREGEPVAAALLAAGVRVFRKTRKRGESRGLFCAIGRCTDCMMVVDGAANTRTCITPVREGMDVKTQFGLGERNNPCGR
jgi:predicted molibdopterin-dependent oxidoreductase YjgC